MLLFFGVFAVYDLTSIETTRRAIGSCKHFSAVTTKAMTFFVKSASISLLWYSDYLFFESPRHAFTLPF